MSQATENALAKSTQAKLDRIQARHAHADLVKRLVKPGDVLTHTRCMGIIEEHEFTSWSGKWMCGIPTRDTFLFGGANGIPSEGKRTSIWNLADDISPTNVTHINRVPVESIEFLANQGKA